MEPTPIQPSLAAGQAALSAADWAGARRHFEAALAECDSPEAHDGLGIALWWLNQVEASHEQRALAYAAFKKQGSLRQAAAIAAWLAREQVFLRSNVSAMNGWFARAGRLLDEAGPCVEYGWLTLMQASMNAPPADLEEAATRAIELAHHYHDADLEAIALAFAGLARVALGRPAEGLLNVDEAMAAAMSGEVANFMTFSEIFCVALSACELAHDLARTEHWCHIAAEFARKHDCPFLSAYCRTTYGGLLMASGRWQAAETELLEAIRAFDAGHRGLRVHAVLKLADLRVCQGRLEEAEALLSGYEDYGEAALPLARLHLSRGDAPLARAVLEQAVGPQPSPTLDKAPLLGLLVDVHLALGDNEAALRAARRLAQIAADTRSPLLTAQARLVEGKVRQAGGEDGAAECYQAAIDLLNSYEQSLLAGRARLEMARLLAPGDWAGAVSWARAALASFGRLGATRDADEAANLLRQLGATGRSAPRLQGQLSQRETEVLSLLARGLSNREIAARLFISAKTVEHHVSQVLGKLGLRTRAEAAAEGLRQTMDDGR